MNKRIIVTIVAIGLGVSAFGGQTPNKQRLDAIWEALDDRVSRQIDVWFDDGDFPKAIHLLKAEADYAPADYEVVTNLGWMQENVEDWDDALATYRKYRVGNPQEKDAALPEGQYYFMKKQYAKIPPVLEPTLARHPHPNIYRILANGYERMHRYSDSIRVWNAYLTVHPKDGQAKVNLARVQRKAKLPPQKKA